MESSENPVRIRFVDPNVGPIETTTELSGVEEIRVFRKTGRKYPAVGEALYRVVYMRYRAPEETSDDIELHFPSVLGFAARPCHRCIIIKPQYSSWAGEPYEFSDFIDKLPDTDEVLRAARACLFNIADLYVSNGCSWDNCRENDDGKVCIIYTNNNGNGYEYDDTYTDPEELVDPKNGEYVLMHNADVIRLVEENCKGLAFEDWSGKVGAKCGDQEWIVDAVDRLVKPVVEAPGFGKPYYGPLADLPDWAWVTLSMYEHGLRSWSVDACKNLDDPDGVLYCDPDWIKETREYGNTDAEIEEMFEKACAYAANILSDTSLSYEICDMGIGPLGNVLWHEVSGPFFGDTIKQDMEDACRNIIGERIKYEIVNNDNDY